ncbi:pro-corazonin [Linepithema humile]|uniref:pro-corazonin n=1 Tax=Linepithema humile TaxID=83485 RepID=UPI0006238B3D|nr:PREDICTED: pro-corazonin-like [Linepithema humile]
MANKPIFALFVLSLVTSTVLCQTFQYSRGWTNGKRSEFPNTAEISNLGNERFTSGEFKTLKMLLHGNADEQPLLISSDFMEKLRKLAQKVNYILQLRQEKGQNDDNY